MTRKPRLSWRKKKTTGASHGTTKGSILRYGDVDIVRTQRHDGQWFWFGGHADLGRWNTASSLVATEAEAKEQAVAAVQTALTAHFAKQIAAETKDAKCATC